MIIYTIKQFWNMYGWYFIFFGSIFFVFKSHETPQEYLLPSPQTSSVASQTSVSLPLETDIIRTFFNLIAERRVSDAVSMMSESINKNDNQKQLWGVQLNAMKSVKIISIDSSLPEEWSTTRHTYKVTMNVTMDPNSANNHIPFYGYENGTNIRWVTLIKEENIWKIESIATGP